MSAKTAGQELATTLRAFLHIGTRTRRYRNKTDMHVQMIHVIQAATLYPGYFTGETNRVLTAAWAIYCAWDKHVGGYRIDGVLRARINEMSPWQFANLLGQMVDAGVTNNGQAEIFFQKLARN